MAGRFLIGVVGGERVEDDVQGHVEVPVVDRSVQGGFERAAAVEDDAGVAREVFLAGGDEGLTLPRRATPAVSYTASRRSRACGSSGSSQRLIQGTTSAWL